MLQNYNEAVQGVLHLTEIKINEITIKLYQI